MKTKVFILLAILVIFSTSTFAGKFTFDVKVSPAKPPQLAVVSTSIDDQNGNSLVEPMENVEVTVRIRNEGSGLAKGTEVDLALGNNVYIIGKGTTHFNIGDLKPGESKDIVFMFYTNKKIRAGERIPIAVKFNDHRSRFSTTAKLDIKMNARQKTADKLTPSGGAVPAPDLNTNPNPELALHGWYEKQYAIVIGIDKYKYRRIDTLQNAVNDAKAIAKLFKKMKFEVTELYNKDASRKAILSSFSETTKNARRNNSVVFYFAGHGQGILLANGEQVGYIIPYDADIDMRQADVIQYDEEAIPLNTIRKYTKNMRAKHIALLFDSCFSGLAMKRSLPTLANVNVDYYNDLLRRRTINILTAGDDQPVSDGSGHSPFTQALLNALDKGGLDINDRDGLATFNQLAVYVKEKVEKATGRRQRPQFDNLSMDDGDFIFKLR